MEDDVLAQLARLAPVDKVKHHLRNLQEASEMPGLPTYWRRYYIRLYINAIEELLKEWK